MSMDIYLLYRYTVNSEKYSVIFKIVDFIEFGIYIILVM